MQLILLLLRTALFTLLIVTPVSRATGEQYDEYAVKAGLLYHFTKFIHWPTDRVNRRHYKICVYGDDPYGYRLDALEEKDQSDITVYRYELLNESLTSCQILFISQDTDLAKTTSFLRAHPILTVGETEGFILAGGMIGLVREKNKIKIEVNLTTANAAGLEMSSQLLRIAKRVIREKTP